MSSPSLGVACDDDLNDEATPPVCPSEVGRAALLNVEMEGVMGRGRREDGGRGGGDEGEGSICMCQPPLYQRYDHPCIRDVTTPVPEI